MNRKQLIYLFIGAVAVLFVFVIFLAFQQGTQPTASKISAGVTPVPSTADGGAAPASTDKKVVQVKPLPVQTSAPDTAVGFYNSLASGNPLANGAFKTNPYLSDEFKQNIANYYDNGNKPIFCVKNRRPQVTLGKEQQLYYAKEYLTEETLVDPADGKSLYIVILENLNNTWHVFDVTCL